MNKTGIEFAVYNGASPCKDCTDRCVNCHSMCVDYKEYRAKIEERKIVYDNSKRADKDFNDYIASNRKH